MKNQMTQRRRFNFCSALLFLLIGFFSSKGYLSASDVSVTANIPDTQAPSAPILIQPSDGALLSDATPSFKWYASTDNIALSHYVFYLDDSILYNNIPLTDVDNSYYLLDYDELNGIYTLTPKNNLSDASHIWKIKAVDYVDLAAFSDTWDFRIDTLSPSFILQKIGDTAVSISAANAASVPTEPILIFTSDATANEPILIASGEASSSVQLTVTIPDDPTQIFNSTIDASGNYQLQLGILPRDTNIRLDFIITDQVGHVSVLEQVYFRIALQYWPPTTPTLTVTSKPPTLTPTVSLSPSLTPSVSVSQSVSPSVSLTGSVTPTGIIPIIPPKEIIHETGKELIKLLPESAANLTRIFLSSKLWKNLSLFFTLLLLILFYLLSFFLILSKFMTDFSWSLVKKVLLLILPNFRQAKKHLVFEYGETLASPLVKVKLLSQNKQLLDFAITNLQGNFDDLAFPRNQNWSLQVEDSNFYYPIGDLRPSQLEFWHFYQNQAINGEDYRGQPILIPTLRAAGQDKLPFLERLRVFALYLLSYPFWFLIFLAFLALIFALRYASFYNYLTLIYCCLMVATKFIPIMIGTKKLHLFAKLTNGQQFSNNLVLSCFDTQSGLQSQSLIVPFDFSKSRVIYHALEQAVLTTFAKNFTLEKDGKPIANQIAVFSQKEEEIVLQIKKI